MATTSLVISQWPLMTQMLGLLLQHGGDDMRTGKRLVHGLVIGLSMCICLTGVLANPAYSQPGYTILHRFAGGPFDGNAPYYGGPVLSGSTLYGMTSDGPQGSGPPPYHYAGTLYKINTDGTGYQILHNFGDINTDGTGPHGALALSGSTLYGFTAYGGGPYAYAIGGSVFKINTDGGGYQILHSFGPPPNTNVQCHPNGTPIVSGSKLYGLATSGSELRPQRRDFRAKHGHKRIPGPARIRR